jgi:ribosomal protein L11 methyltransferase
MVEIQLSPCKREDVDTISEILENLNALSITLTDLHDDPILEPLPGSVPLWPNVVINALFETQKAADFAWQQITTYDAKINLSSKEIAENDWEKTCIADLKPQLFGKNLWICPSWLTPPDPNAITITLDPGLAFGTGTHPTTALCLQWLSENNLSNQDIIDYGCGSGILGIAALKLGARHIYAIDLDPQAIIATQQNAAINNFNPTDLTITLPEIHPPKSDCLIANILLNPLISLKNAFISYLKPNGCLVVSGILHDQVETLIQEYQPQLQHQETRMNGEWALVVFK